MIHIIVKSLKIYWLQLNSNFTELVYPKKLSLLIGASNFEVCECDFILPTKDFKVVNAYEYEHNLCFRSNYNYIVSSVLSANRFILWFRF